MDGCVLLIEYTREIIFSKDVVFSKEIPTPLPDSADSHLDELYIFDDNNDLTDDFTPSSTVNTDFSGDTANEFLPSSQTDIMKRQWMNSYWNQL
jgi:hypothetical protein